jgi:hypothetical protein
MSDFVSLLPLLNRAQRGDQIASGEGTRARTFKNSAAVRIALRQAEISTGSIESEIDALDDGRLLVIPVTNMQYSAFYSFVRAEDE